MIITKSPSVYLLGHVSDDARYDGFVSERFKGFRPRVFNGAKWEPLRLAKKWRPLKVQAGKKSLWHDFPRLNGDHAFSRRAVDALRDMLEPNGELLPLTTPSGEFYAFNPTTVADVLDRSAAVLTWQSEDHDLALWVDYYAFHDDKLEGKDVFRIPEDFISVFVSQRFVDRIESAGLTGFNPVKVWPFPPGVDWREKSARADKIRAARGLPRGKSPEQESVVIRLALSRGNKGTPVERAKIDAYMDQLDSMLVDLTTSSHLVGSLKGHEYVGRECDLYLVCPDASKLAAKLVPWASKIAWDGEVQMIERTVAYDVTEGIEKNMALARPALPDSAPRLKPLVGIVPTEYRE